MSRLNTTDRVNMIFPIAIALAFTIIASADAAVITGCPLEQTVVGSPAAPKVYEIGSGVTTIADCTFTMSTVQFAIDDDATLDLVRVEFTFGGGLTFTGASRMRNVAVRIVDSTITVDKGAAMALLFSAESMSNVSLSVIDSVLALAQSGRGAAVVYAASIQTRVATKCPSLRRTPKSPLSPTSRQSSERSISIRQSRKKGTAQPLESSPTARNLQS
jgi:hypothetical protein